MNKKISSALISVFYKDGLEPLARTLAAQNVTIYSTGGTQQFLEGLGIPCVAVESITHYPSILGGRVKTLHPKIFGGILGRRNEEQDLLEMKEYEIPEMDLVIVDLYPFEETLSQTNEEQKIIEKIDIGGPSMIRAAAKNFRDVAVIASKNDYVLVNNWLNAQEGQLNLDQRKRLAAKAFEVVMHYDMAISNYFNSSDKTLRYGENPHQKAVFRGRMDQLFSQLHGKELSYNNLVDLDAALELMIDLDSSKTFFSIIKHTNVCGLAYGKSSAEAWQRALAGDPESAFGGIISTNKKVDAAVANAIQEIFFEVLIAPEFDEDALQILKLKKNRILLQLIGHYRTGNKQTKTLLNGELIQDKDQGNFTEWKECGGRKCNETEREDLVFANVIGKHLKSNAIALVKDLQMVGKGCGQTSRIDSLRQAIAKAKQFGFDLQGAVLASDAFFPFDDCVKMAHEAGIECFIQPGGSIRDQDSIAYCVENNLVLILTGIRHFRH